MVEMMWCYNCGWVGTDDELESGVPEDVDVEGDGAEISYYQSTPSCCPECFHTVSLADELDGEV